MLLYYANLMNTVIDTLFEVAMKPEEREKYDELGTPYYALYLWAFERYFTRGESERKDRGKTGGACARSAGSLNFLRKAADCVKGEMQIPNRKIVVGNPAQIKGDVSDGMLAWKTKGTELYQQLPKECAELMKECKPLTEIEENRKEKQEITFDTWKQTQ